MKASDITTDPVAAAKHAGLRYSSDNQPGIARKRSGSGFRYVSADGKPLRDKDALRRIKSLVIPPAWTDVWICAHANGHLQTTGRDVRGRKQSRYHPHWREVRDETKYERMMAFGQSLPLIRKRVEEHLAGPGLSREKVLATVVRLLELTFIRVGNEEYAKENKSYGLTTMRGRHVQVEGATITFKFKGKSGVQHAIHLEDRRMARIIQRCQDLPGYELFQYVDENGDHRAIDSSDVNEYLQAISQQPFTAKDFRTWAGTLLACAMLREYEHSETQAQAKKNVTQAIAQVAARLGNTPSVCKKCYIHPAVLDCYMSGAMVEVLKQRVGHALADGAETLRRDELAVMRLLKHHLSTEAA